jgi:GNAT superfamily N-acetyltransferase
MSDDAFPVSDQPGPGDVAQLDDNLYVFNVAATGIDDGRLMSIMLKDPSGAIYAGLHGHTWGNCCEIKTIWVAEERRGHGLGARLLSSAESEARRRGCRTVLLATHSFQAPRFYARFGYETVAVIAGYPAGYDQILMRKALGA